MDKKIWIYLGVAVVIGVVAYCIWKKKNKAPKTP